MRLGRIDTELGTRYTRKCVWVQPALRRGAVAQLGERVNGIHEVGGSIPLGSTSGNALGKLFFPGRFFIASLECFRTIKAEVHHDSL